MSPLSLLQIKQYFRVYDAETCQSNEENVLSYLRDGKLSFNLNLLQSKYPRIHRCYYRYFVFYTSTQTEKVWIRCNWEASSEHCTSSPKGQCYIIYRLVLVSCNKKFQYIQYVGTRKFRISFKNLSLCVVGWPWSWHIKVPTKHDSMNIGKGSQLEKHGFGSLHNLTWAFYYNEDILLRHWFRFTN